MKNIIAILLVLFIYCDCASSTKKEMTENEHLFRAKCASCHSLPNPKKYQYEEWMKIIESHKDRISLSEKEKSLIVNYIFK